MSLPILLRPEALADLLEARDWYEQQRAGLGEAFAEAVDQILARIEMMPELYGVVFRKVRQGKLRRFPYVLYYRVLADWIEVIAILHGGRDPRVWQDRV
jgi:plasmid stabilization system protein ParE